VTGFALKAVIIVIVIALVAIVIARMFHRPAPIEERHDRPQRRMPLWAWLTAAALLVIAFVLALVSFVSRYTADLLLMRVAAVVALLAGGVVLLVAGRRARRR